MLRSAIRINSIALGGELDCRKWNVPITVGLTYTFSYTHHTLGDKNGFKNVDNASIILIIIFDVILIIIICNNINKKIKVLYYFCRYK